LKPLHLKERSSLTITLAVLLALASLTIIALAQDTYLMNIKSVDTMDFEGNLKKTFIKGEVVNVNATLEYPVLYEKPPSVSYLALIRITDPASRMIILSHSVDTISQGEVKAFGGGGQIPLDAPSGTYEAKVCVWNGWVSVMGENWESYAAPVSTTFTVTAG